MCLRSVHHPDCNHLAWERIACGTRNCINQIVANPPDRPGNCPSCTLTSPPTTSESSGSSRSTRSVVSNFSRSSRSSGGSR
jgi:hypothetical protein